MKKILFGFVMGAIASGAATYILMKEKIEQDTINDLREELLDSCMKEAMKTAQFQKEEPVEEPKEHGVALDDHELSDQQIHELKQADYRKYYKETEEKVEEEPLADDNDDTQMEYLSKKHNELCKTHPYELITHEEFKNSEWDAIYGKEVLTYHIPDECMTDEDRDVLAYEDVVDMLGPEFERELCDKGKVFVINHRLDTMYEVYSSNISIEDFLKEDDDDLEE